MTEVLKSDIFFTTTTVVVAIIAILIGVFLVYLIRIIRDVRHISRRASQEVDNFADDIGFIRKNIINKGVKVKKTVGNIIGKKSRK